MLDWMFVTFLNEKAISLILQYGILEKLVTLIPITLLGLPRLELILASKPCLFQTLLLRQIPKLQWFGS